MNGLKDFAVVMGATAIVSALLTAFFGWRGRLLGYVRAERPEH